MDLLLFVEHRDQEQGPWLTAETWGETFGPAPWRLPATPLSGDPGTAAVLFGDADGEPLVPLRGLPADPCAEVAALLARLGPAVVDGTWMTAGEAARGDWMRTRPGEAGTTPLDIFIHYHPDIFGRPGYEPRGRLSLPKTGVVTGSWRVPAPAGAIIVAEAAVLATVDGILADATYRGDLVEEVRQRILARPDRPGGTGGGAADPPVLVANRWRWPYHFLAAEFWAMTMPVLWWVSAAAGAEHTRLVCCRVAASTLPRPPRDG
jgi:hypothetical protein